MTPWRILPSQALYAVRMQVVEDGDRFLWGYFNAEAQQSTCHDSGTSMATVAMDVYRLVAVFQNVPKR